MNAMAIFFEQIEKHFASQGELRFMMGGKELTLNLAYKHERAYAAKQLFGALHPQADIDTLLYRHLIRPGDRVMDAGANIGFTVLEALLCGAEKVLAIEPVPPILERLRLLADDHILVEGSALSGKEGEVVVTYSTLLSHCASISPELIGLFPQVFSHDTAQAIVPCCTIDSLYKCFGNFDVWKLDIEGAEVDAMKGAVRTLSLSPPRTIIAEAYDQFFGPFYSEIKDNYPYAKRAFIAKDKYQLVFHDVNVAPSDAHYHTSPMYVFSLEAFGN